MSRKKRRVPASSSSPVPTESQHSKPSTSTPLSIKSVSLVIPPLPKPEQKKAKASPKGHRLGETLANLILVALGFTSGVFSVKLYDRLESRREISSHLARIDASLKNATWMKVKAFRAPIFKEPHKKATAVGMYYKDFRLQIAGKSDEWVKIGPDRYMHLSDLEGIEKTKAF